MKHLVVDMNKCTGCGICMLVCSEKKERSYRPSRARIRTYREELPDGVKVDLCRQCDNAPCAAVCPVDAITRTGDSVWIVDGKSCIGCGKCVEACPFGAMFLDSETGVAFKCDLCDGVPPCVEQCPKGALKIDLGE